jgi:hypothetical protein
MGGVSYDRMSSQHGRARWWRAGRHAVLATALVLLAVPGFGHAAVRRTHVTQATALSTTAEPSADCTIFSGSPTSAAQCRSGSDDLVGSDGNGALYRTMVSFAGGLGIPAGSHILSSTLSINVLGAFGSTATWVLGMTRSFTPGSATWDTYDGVHPWTTAGGDYNDSLQASATVQGAGTQSFSITPMTQAWLDGANPVPELMILGFSPAGNVFSFSNRASGDGPVLTIAYQPPAPTPPPTSTTPTSPSPTPTPVVTTPVSTPLPRPTAKHALKVKVLLKWTWNHAIVRLRQVKTGGMPGDTRLTLRCKGRGCTRPSDVTVRGARNVRAMLRSLIGHRYRAGDVLTVTLTAARYTAEAATITFRNGRLPLVRPVRHAAASRLSASS